MRTSSRPLERTRARVVVADKLTYAGNLVSLSAVSGHPRFVFVQADIADRNAVQALFREHRPRWVVNFAAETHARRRPLDRRAPRVPRHQRRRNLRVAGGGARLPGRGRCCRRRVRFLHVSTDEVYGSPAHLATRRRPTRRTRRTPPPRRPPTISSAPTTTFGVPALTTNCSNNYGPYQYPEKLIPLLLLNALDGQPPPIYGDGGNVRDLYVEDHREAILLAPRARAAASGRTWALTTSARISRSWSSLCAVLERERPAASNPALAGRGIARYADLKTFSRSAGHDRRYAIDAHATRAGWAPRHDFADGLRRTVRGTSRTGTGATPCRPDATDVSGSACRRRVPKSHGQPTASA